MTPPPGNVRPDGTRREPAIVIDIYDAPKPRRSWTIGGWSRDDDEIRYPDIMVALYAITADLIADGWWIEHCDVLGRSRLDGKIEPRIIAMRWHEGRVVDSPRWRYITDPNEPKFNDKVPLRCGGKA